MPVAFSASADRNLSPCRSRNQNARFTSTSSAIRNGITSTLPRSRATSYVPSFCVRGGSFRENRPESTKLGPRVDPFASNIISPIISPIKYELASVQKRCFQAGASLPTFFGFVRSSMYPVRWGLVCLVKLSRDRKCGNGFFPKQRGDHKKTSSGGFFVTKRQRYERENTETKMSWRTEGFLPVFIGARRRPFQK